MSAAVGWGALAASSLVIGALVGMARPWPSRLVGLVLAFGAGALISAVSFDLAQEGAQVGDDAVVGLGLAAGAITYFALDRLLGRRGRRRQRRRPAAERRPRARARRVPRRDPRADRARHRHRRRRGSQRGSARRDLRLQPSRGDRLVHRDARRGYAPSTIRRLWLLVALVCAAATVVGYAIADNVSGNLNAGVDGFAAGALLVMLIDSMIPEAVRKGGDISGLVTVLGFAVAAALSSIS